MTFDLSDVVVLAIIGFIQAVVLAMLAIILKRAEATKKDVAATKEQIVNDHPAQPNFREENDRRHNETKRWFWSLWTDQNGIKQSQEGIKETLDKQDDMLLYLATGFTENRDRIVKLEMGRNNDKPES